MRIFVNFTSKLICLTTFKQSLVLPVKPRCWLSAMIPKHSLCCCAVSTIGFGLVLEMGVVETLKLLLWVVFVDCIGVGLLISTIMW